MKFWIIVVAIIVIYLIFLHKKKDKVDNFSGPLSDEKILPKHKVTINKDLAIR